MLKMGSTEAMILSLNEREKIENHNHNRRQPIPNIFIPNFDLSIGFVSQRPNKYQQRQQQQQQLASNCILTRTYTPTNDFQMKLCSIYKADASTGENEIENWIFRESSINGHRCTHIRTHTLTQSISLAAKIHATT